MPAGEIREPWVFVSETSAIIYWQTDNPARSWVEYGLTPRCEQKTPLSAVSPVTGQPYWTHFHRLRALEPEKTYYYRMVSLGTDGSTSASEVKTLTTRRYSRAVRIPDDLSGRPYVLDRPNTTYLLTRDVVFGLGGLVIKAEGVTVDLDGHTLTYNDEKAVRPAEWDKRAYEGHDFGIKIEGRFRARILNGCVRQGRGNTPGTPAGIGCNPIYSGGISVEIAGVEIVWSGDDVGGMFLHWGENDHVHHCVMEDLGTRVSDRHMGVRTAGGSGWADYDHNLVKCARHQALVGGVRVTHNEIYLCSMATNSFGVSPSAAAARPVEVAHNRIFGIGEHPVGIAMFGAFLPGSTVHHNWVEVKCTRKGQEYGYAGSACFRTTWGADHLDVGHNTFVAYADVYAGEPAKARALWVGLPAFTPRGSKAPVADARAIFHDNLIIARGPEGAPAGAICVVCLNQSPHLIFKDNRVHSTWGNVVLADSYGHADGHAKFVGNVFVREGRAADYFTIRQEYGGIPATGTFFQNRYQGAPAEQAIRLQAKGQVTFLERVDIRVEDEAGQALGGAKVVVRDKDSRLMLANITPEQPTEAMLVSREGPALAVERPLRPGARAYIQSLVLAKGQLIAILPRAVVTAGETTRQTNYAVHVAKEGYQSASQTFSLDRTTSVVVKLARGR